MPDYPQATSAWAVPGSFETTALSGIATGLTNGAPAYFYVVANGWGEVSPWSNIASATPTGNLPNPPLSLTATGGNLSIGLSWKQGLNDATYNVYRSTTNGGPYNTLVAQGLTTTGTIDTNVMVGTNYYYVVTAYNGPYGPSAYSNQACATPYVAVYPINIQPNPPFGFLPTPMTVAPWMADVEPVDTSEASDGPSGAISVNLAYGVAKFDSGPDLIIPNTLGPDISFGRMYRTATAAGNLSSPGLPPGWTHTWDYWMVPLTPGAWGAIQLVYPNGASEQIIPNVDGSGNLSLNSSGAPTFITLAGAPYVATGVPSATKGIWTQLALQHNGLAQEIFTVPSGDTVFRLQTKVLSNGSQINLHYTNPQNQGPAILTSLDNAPVGGSATSELNLAYSGGLLSTAVGTSTIAGTAVSNTRTYTYASGELAQVSYLNSTSPAEWAYSYTTVGGANYLQSASSTDPI